MPAITVASGVRLMAGAPVRPGKHPLGLAGSEGGR